MSDLRIGVLGYGLRGSIARTAHRPGAGSRVTALADPDPAARTEAATAFPGALITSAHRTVLDDPDIDAVLVVTPDHTHAELACEALRAGKPVFVEKPSTSRSSGATRSCAPRTRPAPVSTSATTCAICRSSG